MLFPSGVIISGVEHNSAALLLNDLRYYIIIIQFFESAWMKCVSVHYSAKHQSLACLFSFTVPVLVAFVE